MEKRRVRLEINGVVCGLITQESEGYVVRLKIIELVEEWISGLS